MDNFEALLRENFGPPVNIEAIIRGLGIKLDNKAELDESVAGELARTEDGKFRISVNREDNYFRRRFTMAHELGHYLMHADLIGSGVADSKAYRSVSGTGFSNPRITQREETQANQFASTILLPKSVLHSEVKVGDSLRRLSGVLKASSQAISIRLKGLGYGIDGDEVVKLPNELER